MAATRSSAAAACVVLCVMACGVRGFQTGGDTDGELQPRQGLGAEVSSLLQPSVAQLIQGQNSLPLPLQQRSLAAAGLGAQPQGLQLSLLGLLGGQGLAGTQLGGLGSPLYNLANQGLLGAPFAALGTGLGGPQLLGNPGLGGAQLLGNPGLGGAQLLGNPGLLGMLSGVNRLGGLTATGQPGARQLGSLSPALGLPLLGQAPARQDNLGELIRLASLLSDETRNRRNTLATPGTRIQLTGSFNTPPRHPHPLHRLLSLPVSDLETPSLSRLDDHSSYTTLRGLDHESLNDGGTRRSSSSHPTEFGRALRRPQHPILPLATGTHGRDRHDNFRFPSQ
ncbi:uncharacterized protein LOC126997005 [Eriocheir sinensis]|uniref:uncharacterized protein LOC126997005 n=1 Tax=Eriocheir sinensis TaxID=95602 RepID=UPI0021C8B0F3|nr:uncharacterized protein LOC126997005 [Eriocheir sinensis]